MGDATTSSSVAFVDTWIAPGSPGANDSATVRAFEQSFRDDGDGLGLEGPLSLAGLAAAFATGGAATALGVIVAAGGFVSTVLPPENGSKVDAPMKGNSADEVYSNMVEALNKLSTGIHADLDVYRQVGYEMMPNVAGEMGRAAASASSCRDSSMWLRPSVFGLGAQGPFQEWSDLHDIATSVVLSWDVTDSTPPDHIRLPNGKVIAN